jgi:hypothetical protein
MSVIRPQRAADRLAGHSRKGQLVKEFFKVQMMVEPGLPGSCSTRSAHSTFGRPCPDCALQAATQAMLDIDGTI